MYHRFFAFLIIMALGACADKSDPLFVPMDGEDSGVVFENRLPPNNEITIQDYLYYYNGGGVALGDINNDGLCDIFLTGNQVKNGLYLNNGNLKFQDISETAGIQGTGSWNTGCVMHDFNADGWLDIYVMAVSGIYGFKGRNELYLNNGDNTFTESAANYGLDKAMFGTTAGFLDYDQDGDLDMYLLNHAVHDEVRITHANKRYQRDSLSGDILFRNDNGRFTDVSAKAGIYGGGNGYGLGLAISDFNGDGWPDMYVANDFHEDDYFYLNNQNGTFIEGSRQMFGMQSRFSMGNDVADINADGFPDLITLDMLPEDEKILKASESDDKLQIEIMRTQDYGYHHQFSRNMLHMNQNGDFFVERALQTDLAATDWSWSALFGDYDMDGNQDLYISNGIIKRPNDLDYINYISTLYFNGTPPKGDKMKAALAKMPSGKVPNKLFKGQGNGMFSDITAERTPNMPSAVSATAMADLDNDGDLDLVGNTVNGRVRLLMNTTDGQRNYLKMKLHFTAQNPFAIGTKVFSYHNGLSQYKELYTSRGFQSSSEPIVHFGYGKTPTIDSIKIVWPNKAVSILTDVRTNQCLDVQYGQQDGIPLKKGQHGFPEKGLFTKLSSNLGIAVTLPSDIRNDFLHQKLLPYHISRPSWKTQVHDFNQDGKLDVAIKEGPGAKGSLFLQDKTEFKKMMPQEEIPIGNGNHLALVRIKEDAGHQKIGLQSAERIIPVDSPVFFNRSTKLFFNDFDQDQDQDILVLNYADTNDFGKPVSSYLLNNQGTHYNARALQRTPAWGMPTDAVFTDIDNDEDNDIIIIGEWMPPIAYLNQGGTFQPWSLGNTLRKGLWQKIMPFDIDGDGDTDYVMGNWGNNSKFKASTDFPMAMYYSDFDENGQKETVLAMAKDDKYYPLETFSSLTEQMVFLKKKFRSFASFAGKDMTEIFGENALTKAKKFSVSELRSGYLENTDSGFSFVPFDDELQLAPIREFLKFDFDGDGKKELLAAGNFFGLKPFHGRLGSFQGALIEQDGQMLNAREIGLDLVFKATAEMSIIRYNNTPYLLILYEGRPAEVYAINSYRQQDRKKS